MSEKTPVNPTFHQALSSERAMRWLESRSPRYHEYRRKWKENPQNYINEGYPLCLDIEASAACNLKCPMCPRTIYENQRNANFRSSKHFDFELYKRVIDEAAELGVYAVKLIWFGEPLMNPRILDMIAYAKRKGIEEVSLNTNAVLLDEKMSRGIIEAGLDGLYFSFDAPDKETYEKIRIGASYEQVLGNIKRFHEIRDELNSIVPFTRAQMVVMPENQAALQEYMDLFGNIVDAVFYSDYEDHSDFKRHYDELQKSKDIEFSCFQLWTRMYLSAEGGIARCCYDVDEFTGLGNIRDTTIHAAWNSDFYETIREGHKNFQWHKFKLCSQCPKVFLNKSGAV